MLRSVRWLRCPSCCAPGGSWEPRAVFVMAESSSSLRKDQTKPPEETNTYNEGGVTKGIAPDDKENTATSGELSFLEPSTDPKSIGKMANFEVLSVLGRGGMGTVLKAFDVKLHRQVAIKVMHSSLAALDENRRRFVREARIAASINHPNVVAIYEVDDQRGTPYLVMEFVPGLTLAERIRRGPRF